VDPYAPDPSDKPSREPEGVLGKGPLLGSAPADAGASVSLHDRLAESARGSSIPIQSVTCGALHDGSPFVGRAVAVVGVPLRFPGTPSEMIDRNDLESLVRWLEGYLEEGR
jgi:putative aminopeptidase FrvX